MKIKVPRISIDDGKIKTPPTAIPNSAGTTIFHAAILIAKPNSNTKDKVIFSDLLFFILLDLIWDECDLRTSCL